eukprot:gb/GECH01013944.1/.p1 GENE.gb/GECH01013944.1/~~gb/GECH01013944.1/.p1  ORF type:complete len:237 (+),score=65.60 gb/GECH01013944.1/:1-711(+)
MSNNNNNNILIAVTSNNSNIWPNGRKTGFWWSEVAHPYRVFKDAGYNVDFVSETGTTFVDETSVDRENMDKVAQDLWEGSDLRDTIMNRIQKASEVEPSYYQGIFFAGGHGAAFDFPQANHLKRLAREIYELDNGFIGAVCHGVMIFDGVNIINSFSVTGFSDEEEEKMGTFRMMLHKGIKTPEQVIREAGGEFVKSPPMQEKVVSGIRVITGQNPSSASATASEMVRQLRKSVSI